MIISNIYKNPLSWRFVKFSAVGASGVIVNMALLWILKEKLGMYYLIASLIAIETSVLTNFFLNDIWTWKDRQKTPGWGYLRRLLKYNLSVSIAAVVGNLFILATLTEIYGWNYLLANLVGIIAGTLINFIINDLWTFRDSPVKSEMNNISG